MGIISRGATFTIGDDPLVDEYAADHGDSDTSARDETSEPQPAAAPDPTRTRELLLEARDRARGRRRRTGRALRSERGASWSPRTLIAAGALVLTGLIAGTLGARLAHSHASPQPGANAHAERHPARPHDRRVRPHRPRPRWHARPAHAANATRHAVTATSSPETIPVTPTAARRLPGSASPTPNPTRPLHPAQPGGEFVLGGP